MLSCPFYSDCYLHSSTEIAIFAFNLFAPTFLMVIKSTKGIRCQLRTTLTVYKPEGIERLEEGITLCCCLAGANAGHKFTASP